MPVCIDWYNETQTVILCHYTGSWTIAENVEAEAAIQRLSRQVAGRFDIMADFNEAVYTPPVGALHAWKQNVTLRDSMFPNWGLTVSISSNPVYNAFFEAGTATSDVIRKHCRFAKNVVEAVQIILVDRANS